MSQHNDHSRRLKAGVNNFTKVAAEVQSAFIHAEDALTVLEDREARRSQRNVSNARDPRQTVRGI